MNVDLASFPAQDSHDFGFDIRTEVINQFLRATVISGSMDGDMTYTSEDEGARNFLLLQCEGAEICIWTFIKKAPLLYPGRYTGLYWDFTDLRIETGNDEITIFAMGRLDINAENGTTQSAKLFSSEFTVNVPVQLKSTKGRIDAKASGIVGSLTIDQPIVGTILTPEIQGLVNTKFFRKTINSVLLTHE